MRPVGRSGPVRLLLIGVDSQTATTLVASVGDLCSDIRTTARPDALEGALQRDRPDIVVVNAELKIAAERVAAARLCHPRVEFLALADAPSSAAHRWAMEASCSDLIIRSVGPTDLRRAVQNCVSRGTLGGGDVITLLGGKGGVGTTALAVNLGACLAARGASVVVVDLQIYLGDVAWTAGVPPKPSLQWALGRRLDSGLHTLARHPLGFAVLGPDPDLAEAKPIGAGQVAGLLDALVRSWRHVIVDAGAALTEEALAALSTATSVLVVTTEERAALEGARRRIAGLLPVLRHPHAASVVLNRSTGTMESAALEAYAGAPVLGSVRNAWAEVSAAIESHDPLIHSAPHAGVTGDLCQLADQIAGPQAAATPIPVKSGLWARLGLGV